MEQIQGTEFLDKLKSQDHQAFSRLVEEYHHSLLAVARPIVGDGWAEEVVQEAWVSIFKALPNFQQRSSLKTWMLTILKNEAFSRYKKEKRTVSLDSQTDHERSDERLDEWLHQAFRQDGHWAKAP